MIAATPFDNPWAFVAHPEVWLLVGFLVGSYVYLVRVIGPKAVGPGQTVVSRRQVTYFSSGMLLLWIGADWPVHDVGEEYLYSLHMFQHMVFTLFAPPLLVMSMPTWMARTLLGEGFTHRAVRWLARPVIAGVAFNLMAMVTHIPLVVNASTENAPLHYGLHFFLFTASMLMWTPVVGPIPEWQMRPHTKAIYLFLMSVVPTVPAGWLTFAEGVVYDTYATPVRVWGLTVTEDQQIAGAIMKLGGAAFLWSVAVFLWFKRFAPQFEETNTYRRAGRMPSAEIVGNDEAPLMFAEVSAAFERSEPPVVESDESRDR